jgi:riboflavin kinase/FMN adenylyltransferase
LVDFNQMKTIFELSELQSLEKGCVLTIGNFDGVHLGHREILKAAGRAAAKRGKTLTVMTFEPHPVAILQPDRLPGVLTTLNLKSRLLRELDTDCLLVLKSEPELLSLSAADFVDRFLVQAIQPSVVVEGEDFNFGCNRSGNLDKLQQLGAEKGFKVCIVNAKRVAISNGDVVRVSSTIIRKLLEQGSVADAASVLGRPYRLVGTVVRGRGKGKQLGFPTANLEQQGQIIPNEGVYAGLAATADTLDQLLDAPVAAPAVFSIGTAPTLGNKRPQLIEAHLLQENVARLTDKWMAMDFVQKLRNQQKFAGEKELAEQIAKDCRKAQQLLSAL